MSQEHTTTPPRLRFGTLDWRHAQWAEHYYPGDLPEDWRLGYYANELGAVLLPPQAWRGESPDGLAAWADEVHAGFRFYLIADAGADAGAQQAQAVALGERLGALLWPSAPAPAGLAALLPDLPERVRAWGDQEGVRLALLEVGGLDLRGRRVLLEQLASRLSQLEGAAVILSGTTVTPADARELQTVAELMGLA